MIEINSKTEIEGKSFKFESSINLGEVLISEEPYCKRLYFRTSEGIVKGFDTEILSAATTTRFGSEFSVSLKVSIPSNALSGSEIVEIFFKLNGEKELTIAKGLMVTKRSRPLIVGVRINIKVDLENCRLLISDDNALARVILGLEACSKSDISFNLTEDIFHESSGFSIANSPVEDFSIDNNTGGITLRVTATSEAKEIVMFVRGSSVLRVPLAPFFVRQLSISQTTSPASTVRIAPNMVVQQVAVTGISQMHPIDTRVVTQARDIIAPQENKLSFNFDSDRRFIAESFGSLAAIVSDRQAQIIDIVNGRASIVATLEIQDEQKIFLAGGNMVIRASLSSFEIFEVSAERGLEFVRSINFRARRNEIFQMILNNNRILVAFENSAGLRREAESYLISSGAGRNETVVGAVEPVTFHRVRTGLLIFLAGQWCQAMDIGGNLQTLNHSAFIRANPSFQLKAVSNSLMHLSAGSGVFREDAIVSLFSGRVTPITGGTEFIGFSDECVAVLPSGEKRFMVYNHDDDSISFRSTEPFGNPEEVIRLKGFYIARFADGSLRDFIEVPKNQMIMNPRITPNTTLTLVVNASTFESGGVRQVELEFG